MPKLPTGPIFPENFGPGPKFLADLIYRDKPCVEQNQRVIIGRSVVAYLPDLRRAVNYQTLSLG